MGARLLLCVFMISVVLCQPVCSGASGKEGRDWQQILEKGKGQTVYFNGWGGSDVINDSTFRVDLAH